MPHNPSWQQLAERASNEIDPEKMIEIVEQLNQALEKRERMFRAAPHENLVGR